MQVGWDESTAGERQPRVSLWEIEPLTTFPMYPSPFPLRLKRPWQPGLPSFHGMVVYSYLGFYMVDKYMQTSYNSYKFMFFFSIPEGGSKQLNKKEKTLAFH